MDANKQNYRKTLLAILSIFSAQFAIADSTTKKPTPSSISSLPFLTKLKHGYAVFEVGGFRSSQGKTQHIQEINIDDLIGDEFNLTQANDNNILLGLGYFIEGKDIYKLKMSYGLNAFYLARTTVAGTITQENLFTNLSYDYSITHYPLYAMVKSAYDLKQSKYALTFDAGIGPNFMHTDNYHNNSLDGGITLADDAFSGHTTATFSATAGIGIKRHNLLGKSSLECGYRFFYLGQGSLTKATEQLINTLNTGTAYANAILCSIII